MSRIFTDSNFLTWETYASGGKFGLPDEPSVIFHCLSDPESRARFTVVEGDEASAEQAVHAMSDDQLRSMLSQTRPLD